MPTTTRNHRTINFRVLFEFSGDRIIFPWDIARCSFAACSSCNLQKENAFGSVTRSGFTSFTLAQFCRRIRRVTTILCESSSELFLFSVISITFQLCLSTITQPSNVETAAFAGAHDSFFQSVCEVSAYSVHFSGLILRVQELWFISWISSSMVDISRPGNPAQIQKLLRVSYERNQYLAQPPAISCSFQSLSSGGAP